MLTEKAIIPFSVVHQIPNILHAKFEHLVRLSCCSDTSAHPRQWSSKNPFMGHCTIVSLLAQDIFGGVVLRASLEGVPGFEEVRRHSWNRLSANNEIDFTKTQFNTPLPRERLTVRIATREELFSYPRIQERYRLLARRFHQMCKVNMFLLTLPPKELVRAHSH